MVCLWLINWVSTWIYLVWFRKAPSCGSLLAMVFAIVDPTAIYNVIVIYTYHIISTFKFWPGYLSQMLHGAGMITYIYSKNGPVLKVNFPAPWSIWVYTFNGYKNWLPDLLTQIWSLGLEKVSFSPVFFMPCFFRTSRAENPPLLKGTSMGKL